MNKYAVNKDKGIHYRKLPGSNSDKINVDDSPVNNVEITPIIIINKECPICFDEIYSNEEYLVFDTCNHSYHLKCINQWKCQCNSVSTIFKCELCQEYRDIKEFNQSEAEPEEVKRPKKINWIKRCIRNLFG